MMDDKIYKLIQQQNAEIKMLQKDSRQGKDIMSTMLYRNSEEISDVICKERSNAIIEFAEMLKERFGICDCIVAVDNTDIDNLVKEMAMEERQELK